MMDETTTPAPQPDDDEAEVEAIASVARALKGLSSETRRRVIDWAAGKYGAATVTPAAPSGDQSSGRRRRTPSSATGRTGTASSKTTTRRKAGALSLDKSLDLHPKGMQSFAGFATAKAPKSTYEKNVVAVYWLTRVAGQDAATVDQVFSCYKGHGWRVPANLRNNLAVTSSTKGWIDSSSMESIKVTVGGENYVEHDLPAKAKA